MIKYLVIAVLVAGCGQPHAAEPPPAAPTTTEGAERVLAPSAPSDDDGPQPHDFLPTEATVAAADTGSPRTCVSPVRRTVLDSVRYEAFRGAEDEA